MAVTEEQLEKLLKRHHWTISRSRTGNQFSFSGRQGPAKQRITRYIATAKKLVSMTEEDVLAKLNRPARKKS